MDLPDPRVVLAAAASILQAPIGAMLEPLSQALSGFLPHRALAMLTGDCARHPMKTYGDPALTEKITSAELARMGGAVDVGEPWFGEMRLAGGQLPALAVAARPPGASGALLVVVTAGGTAPAAPVRDLVRRLWDLVAVELSHRAANLPPAGLSGSRVAAGERARAIAELTGAHAATLKALLGALRSRSLDDGAARRAAIDLAVSALIELRAAGDLDRSLSEEPAGTAFDRLADKLAPLTRYSEVSLELVGPRERDHALPGDLASAAQALVRGTIVTMLEYEGLTRIRATWELSDAELLVAVRDDGPGVLTADALPVRRLAELAAAVGGRLTLDSVPGWGTTVTAVLPLAPAAPGSQGDALAALKPRELEVLERLARGLRNRQIAEELLISEHTVKFHVANILDKLGVGTRTEAAALAHSSGLSTVA
ncbi:helix-turn-helix transcriptional regulator [Nonomuraea turcica]|uniref:helix-turn-helix transcriptional regulator n=1 Tax=Nonomuraea sp. G32 TaxID=3067274 RepID=UPI00273A7CB7|nr:response regulator transcription factor family protein [Nonomuraea sp. G32]MDP4502218.1 LuxR C-terminal-related transcriptional regulator [Nonomuraea sp. G32]